MRPLRIEMTGFAAFAQHTVVDLSDVTLAAIVGPTGAGKSTIIDAITFALYGSVARYDHAGTVTPAICQASHEAKVLVEFEARGVRYTAARRVARVGGTKEARLESDNGDLLAATANDVTAAVKDIIGLDFAQFTKTVVLPQGRFAQFLHDKPSDRQRALSQILDLDAYARVGGRARGIAAELSQRIALLHAEIDRCATSDDAAALTARASELRDAAGAVTELLKQHQDLTGDARDASAAADTAAARWRVAADVAVPVAVRAAATAAAAAANAAEQAATEAATTRRRAGDAAAAAAELPTPERCQQLLAACEHAAETDAALAKAAAAAAAAAEAAETAEQAATAAASAAQETETAQQAATKAATDAKTATAESVQPDLLDRASSLHQRRSDLEQRLTAAAARLDQARLDEDAARRRADDAAEDAAAARDAVHIHHLTASLVAGDDCPVCGQQVHDIPDPATDPDTAAAEQAIADAQSAAGTHNLAMRAAADAAADVEKLTELLAGVDADLEPLPAADTIEDLRATHRTAAETEAAAVEAAETAAAARLAATSHASETRAAAAEAQIEAAKAGSERDAATDKAAAAAAAADGLDPEQINTDLQAARRLADEVDVWAAAAAEADTAAETAAADADTATETLTVLRSGYNTARDLLIGAGFAPPEPDNGLLTDWETLAGYAAEAATEAAEAAEAAQTAAADAAHHAEAVLRRARSVCEDHIDTAATGLDRWGVQLSEAATRAETEAQAATSEAQRRREADTELEQLQTERDTAAALGKHLQADGFERWRMHEAAADLTDRASVVLMDLSGDRYELAPDNGTITVIDHYNSGDSRTAKTLSGGETFLASLALALALAEETASTAGGLDALIIDEGFGSLDADTLDIAAAGLEKLEAMGRMVCVVTHIPALADRMPARFEVARTAGGSTVVPVIP